MKNLIAVLVTAFVLASCSDPVEPTPAPVTYTMPATGTTYTYATYLTDAQGAKVAGSDAERSESVIASNVIFDDQSGVWAIGGVDTTYYFVDKYNDVQMRTNAVKDPYFSIAWARFPLTTGTATSVFNNQRSTDNGVVTQSTKTLSAERIAEESVTVRGAAVRTFKIRVNYSIVIKENESIASDLRGTAYVWFAPSLGTFVRREIPAQSFLGTTIPGVVEVLK